MIPERYKSELRDLLIDSRLFAGARPWLIVRWAVAMVVGTWLLVPVDGWLARSLGGPGPAGLDRLAGTADFWGGFWPLVLPAALVTWALGYARRRRSLRLAALACLLGGAVSGLGAAALGHLTGRPRPWSTAPDGFYGVSTRREFHSFPSRPAATVMGGAAALATVLPATRVPAYGMAALVAWSDFHLRKHRLSDVFFGTLMGLGLGLLLGAAARAAAGRPVRWVDQQADAGFGPLIREWHRLWRRRRMAETHVRVNPPRPGGEGPTKR